MPLLLIQLPIGRGHPNYLNLLKKELNIPYFYIEIPLNISIVKLLNFLYKNSPKNLITLYGYNLLRKKGEIPNFFIKKIKKEIEKFLPKERHLIIVSHPILAKALEDREDIYYLHCENAFPKEAKCNAKKIFAPLEITKKKAISYGIEKEKIVITNLFLEEELISLKEVAYEKRLERIKNKEKLSCAIFLSGAYPKVHIKKIFKYIKYLSLNNIRTFLFSGINYSYYLYFQRKLFIEGIYVIRSKDWEEEIKKFKEIFLDIDFFISASHERTNWALGLSLPMFVLTPFIGSYAKENYEIAKNYGVALLLEEIKKLNKDDLYEKLLEMNKSCYNRFLTNGAQITADIIEKDLSNFNNL
ncbi:MAG: hypothetical protein N2323_06880 [candidate division WOR-3 bacterium]|nr:hypothetical protein [candidate division WOR-3 bacterium]MCX7837649.1 hypothetical protein [candidate division WOR-3 bacterium]MDW8114713.1 hypothetical protein [candidate division WOR-3 bacterium]